FFRKLIPKIIPFSTGLLILLQMSVAVAHADPLQNAYDQKQGNYDFQLKTDPKNPVEHSPAKIVIRLGSIDGSDLVDVPIAVRIVDSNGIVVHKSNPTVVTGGHFVLDYTFEKAGTYAIYADVDDYVYSGQTLTFTFRVNVLSVFDFLY